MKKWMGLLGVLTMVVLVVSAYAPAVDGKEPTTLKVGVGTFETESLDPVFVSAAGIDYMAGVCDTYLTYDWDGTLKAVNDKKGGDYNE